MSDTAKTVETVKLVECPRDAWQGLPPELPTDIKVAYLRALISAGFKHIDAVSFVSPKAVPQMADSEQVLKELDPPDDVEIIAIVVNEKGAERAIASEAVRTIGFPYSVSPTFLKNNQKQTLEEAFDVLEKVKIQADAAAIDMVVYISMAFGNPYGDLWNHEEVVDAVRLVADTGVASISLADTVGLSDAQAVGELMGKVMPSAGGVEVGIHLHSRPETAAAKILAAYDAGCRRFDSALGGLGGCPFAQDALVGNIPTERLLAALSERGVVWPQLKPVDVLLQMSLEIAARNSARPNGHSGWKQ